MPRIHVRYGMDSRNRLDKRPAARVNSPVTTLIETIYRMHPRRQPMARAALRRLIGPGLLVAVGYVDPGNWATEIAAGSAYGYALLGVVFLASALGLLFQNMAARLGVATGEDLARLSARLLPRPFARLCWLAAEAAIVATALAELIGGALALELLFGLPLVLGVTVAAAGTLLVMAMSQAFQRLHERVVGVLMAVVALAFGYLLTRAHPDPAEIWHGMAAGRRLFGDHDMLALSLGILGATIMPHNLYLHSGLVAERCAGMDEAERRRALHVVETDTGVSLLLVTLANAAILIVAAASLNHLGRPIGSLAEAYHALGAQLGPLAAIVFAVALYAAGQSSAITGVLTGRLLSRGFRGRESRLWLRGIATRLAAVCLAIGLFELVPRAGPDRLLVLSQCALGLALPFALLPMLLIAHRHPRLGRRAFSPAFMLCAVLGTALVLALDAYLLIGG